MEARALLGNPVLSTLLASIEADATTRIVTQSLSDDKALRNAAIELKVIRDVRTRLTHLARKEAE